MQQYNEERTRQEQIEHARALEGISPQKHIYPNNAGKQYKFKKDERKKPAPQIVVKKDKSPKLIGHEVDLQTFVNSKNTIAIYNNDGKKIMSGVIVLEFDKFGVKIQTDSNKIGWMFKHMIGFILAE